MTSILITGASRGIGLTLVKYLLNHSNPPKLVIAACRNPSRATELIALAEKDDRLKVVQLDVTKLETFPDFCKKVESLVGPNGLNVLLNNAGILTRRLESIEEITPEDFRECFETNCLGSVFLTKALIPLLKKASEANKEKPLGISRAAILFMSSFLGSVSQNYGRYWAYRESKAALNQSARSFAAEMKPHNILVTVLHPGHVKTDMGGSDAEISLDESVTGLINVMYSLDESKHNTFIKWNSTELQW